MIGPIGILKHGRRAALRRRYAYAALRVWRLAVRHALRVHHERSIDSARPYSVSMTDIMAQYQYGMRRIRARFPKLDYLDERSNPDA